MELSLGIFCTIYGDTIISCTAFRGAILSLHFLSFYMLPFSQALQSLKLS